jgi:aspartyl-tRNA(Asn)/glutamyl-tRNA(Gln) amidotransferase subunit A
VRDAALMLSAMAVPDLRDPLCLREKPRDWRDGIEDGVAGLSVAVIGRPGFDAPADADAIAAVERAAAILDDAGATVRAADVPGLPDVRDVFGRVWGVALARLVAGVDPARRDWLDPGLHEVAAAAGGMSAIEYLESDALRLMTAHAMARFHQTYDLVLCPAVPVGPPDADAPTMDPLRALWTDWAPWTFAFNLSRQPAIAMPLGVRADGMPRAVQIAAAEGRDDLVLRAARVLELAEPVAVLALDPGDQGDA